MNMLPEPLFASLANSTRFRCLMLMVEFPELCVCEFTYVLRAAQPMISRQLALLREAELVTDRREGKWIYYRLNPALPEWVLDILRAAHSEAITQDPCQSDRDVLTAMPNQPKAPRCA
jgi:ArsR family transcriptional regulator